MIICVAYCIHTVPSTELSQPRAANLVYKYNNNNNNNNNSPFKIAFSKTNFTLNSSRNNSTPQSIQASFEELFFKYFSKKSYSPFPGAYFRIAVKNLRKNIVCLTLF